MARYTFSSTPSASNLFVDGEYIGTTPCHAELTSGYYRIKVEHPKYKTFNKRMYLDSSNPELSFRMPYQYQQKNEVYFQPTLQCVKRMGWGGTVGFYLANVNVEGMYLVGEKSIPIYWNYIGKYHQQPVEETFSPTIIAANVGYGIIVSARLRITPQVGVNIVDFVGSYKNRCSAYSASVGARFECIAFKHLGVSLVPSYASPVYKSDNFIRISGTLLQLNEYAVSGFNLRVGGYLYF